ncbi:3-oxoacyl-[acyl-carrier protein] reductase [Roseomonas rosea]|uniref:3-oxoacyl-[acyl-carrier protein] reductase n=1 Tax=Muricoccus roseus TaxID=198092 RepID=A0A1M6RCI4_9PROT|nr:SDR family oxidoreductase [Roseomonas rosea]SHK30174.1 3-oxoacyl-[acyl-carrier protein] reductase [Roseomonas rosea]
MELGLRGKRALVMGASKGLGRAIAEALAADGAALAISGREVERLQPVCEALKGMGATAAHAFSADVAKGEDMDALAEGAVAALGGVDILVLNHGGPPAGTAADLTEEALETWFRRIVLSPVRIANKLLPAMRAQGYGRIIAVGSTGMVQPLPNLALSNVLRANIVGWAKTLADEVGPDGVTVNIIAPGAIRTDRSIELAGAAASKQGKSPEQVIADREKTIPMRRYGTPDEFGKAAAFLASEAGSYITGTILRVDGGVVRGF